MNRLPVALLVVVLAQAAVGCGVSADSGGPTPNPSSGSTAASTYPVSVRNALGDVVVEQRPERVVAIGLSELDTLLGLGVVPVAFGTFGSSDLYDYEAAALDGAPAPEAFDLSNGIPMEKVASYAPDLIVNLSWGDGSDYEKLSKIAPVVSWVKGPFADPWQTMVDQIAPAAGDAKGGEQAVDDTEAAVAGADSTGVLAGKTVAYATAGKNGGLCVVDLPTSPALTFLADLKLVPDPAFLNPRSEYCREVSLENVDEIQSDLMVMLTTDAERSKLEAFAPFAKLDVAAHTVWLNPDSSLANAVNSPTLISIPYLLDELVPQLVAKAS